MKVCGMMCVILCGVAEGAALDPVPIGVQGPQIVLEYVRALKMLPETTPEALKTAADLGLKHPNCQKHIRTEVENQVN